MEIRLQLKQLGDLDALKSASQHEFDTFLSCIFGTQAALLEARKLYGENAYVELEYDSEPKPKFNCWIWLPVLGGKEILGSGETWIEALDDAAGKTSEPEDGE